ncbi:MAG: BA14K family protein [Pseudomonadota bacterium]
MKTTTFKKTTTAVLAAATLATSLTFSTTQDANAGSRDFWAGAAAGVVTGVIVNESAHRYRERRHYREPVRRVSSYDAHVNWCYNRYRSYREWDNSWKPYSGPRRTCFSPYY